MAAISRRRAALGRGTHRSGLTDADDKAIRKAVAAGVSHGKLAARLKVPLSTIEWVVRDSDLRREEIERGRRRGAASSAAGGSSSYQATILRIENSFRREPDPPRKRSRGPGPTGAARQTSLATIIADVCKAAGISPAGLGGLDLAAAGARAAIVQRGRGERLTLARVWSGIADAAENCV